MRTQIAIPVNGAIFRIDPAARYTGKSGCVWQGDLQVWGLPVGLDALHQEIIQRPEFSVLGFGRPVPQAVGFSRRCDWLLYLVAKKRPGAPLAYQTLLHYLKTLRHVARHAESHRLAIRAILSSPEALIAVVCSTGDQHARQLSSLVKMLSHLGPDVRLRGCWAQYAHKATGFDPAKPLISPVHASSQARRQRAGGRSNA